MFVNQSIQKPQGVNAFGSCLRTTRVAKAVRDCVRASPSRTASKTSLAEAFSGDYQNRKKIGTRARSSST